MPVCRVAPSVTGRQRGVIRGRAGRSRPSLVIRDIAKSHSVSGVPAGTSLYPLPVTGDTFVRPPSSIPGTSKNSLSRAKFAPPCPEGELAQKNHKIQSNTHPEIPQDEIPPKFSSPPIFIHTHTYPHLVLAVASHHLDYILHAGKGCLLSKSLRPRSR